MNRLAFISLALFSIAITGLQPASPAFAQNGPDSPPSIAEPQSSRRLNLPPEQELRYGPDKRQIMDLWRPREERRPAPVIVFVHGGWWTQGDKDEYGIGQKVEAFSRLGYVFVSINYRMVPDVALEDEPRDVSSAIRYLRQHARELGIDPERFALMGHSAGAQLSALVSTDPRYLGSDLSAIKAVILLDGAGYDLPLQIEDATPLEQRMYRVSFKALDLAALVHLSPAAHGARPNAAAFLVIHDAARKNAVSQAMILVRALRQAGTPVEQAPIEHSDHVLLDTNVGRAGDPETKIIADFLSRYCPPAAGSDGFGRPSVQPVRTVERGTRIIGRESGDGGPALGAKISGGAAIRPER